MRHDLGLNSQSSGLKANCRGNLLEGKVEIGCVFPIYIFACYISYTIQPSITKQYICINHVFLFTINCLSAQRLIVLSYLQSCTQIIINGRSIKVTRWALVMFQLQKPLTLPAVLQEAVYFCICL